jgi:predicted metal-dependent hydrolase
VPTPDAVEVRRSRRRTRTVTAWREDGVTVVSIPARFTRAQERQWVDTMLGRLAAQDRRRRPSDAVLLQRATQLSRQYLAGRAEPASVSWSGRQGKRWGSCTTVDRTIRLSTRLQGMPRWVVDYVLVHELAHLLRPGHDQEFWALVGRYPETERARGFLDGYAHARGHGDHADEEWDADDEPAVAPEAVEGVLADLGPGGAAGR